ncbi:hypothetical protein Q7P37_001207 [Cladosporium fusiforme]
MDGPSLPRRLRRAGYYNASQLPPVIAAPSRSLRPLTEQISDLLPYLQMYFKSPASGSKTRPRGTLDDSLNEQSNPLPKDSMSHLTAPLDASSNDQFALLPNRSTALPTPTCNTPANLQTTPLFKDATTQLPATSDAPNEQPATTPARPHLLGLPAEIRNHIYRHVVVDNQPIVVQHYTYHESRLFSRTRNTETFSRFSSRMVQPLTLTSRQLRREAQYLLVKENNFKITDASGIFVPDTIKPLHAFRGFCEGFGPGLQSISLTLERVGRIMENRGLVRGAMNADFTVTKGERVLELTKADFEGRCGCYVRYLAHTSDGSIFRFLERLWVYLSMNEDYCAALSCRAHRFRDAFHHDQFYEYYEEPSSTALQRQPCVGDVSWCKNCNMFKF